MNELASLKNEKVSWELQEVKAVYRDGEPIKYLVSLPILTIVNMMENSSLVYNPSVQRGVKINAKGIEIPISSKNKINEIFIELLQGRLHGGILSFNYPKESDESIIFNEFEGVLQGEQSLQIIDGYHRCSSFVKYVNEYKKPKNKKLMPDPANIYFPCCIENLNIQESMSLFSEYSTKFLKVSPTRAKYLDVFSQINQIVRKVITESELEAKVELTSNTLKSKTNDKVVTFAVLTESIKENFKPQSKQQGIEIASFLVEYFNYLASLFPRHFSNLSPIERQDIRSKDMIIQQIFFYGYANAASRLFGKENWKELLSKLKEEIRIDSWIGKIYERECPLWSKIFRDGFKIVNNSSTQKYVGKTIGDYIEFGIDYVLENRK